MKPRAIIVSKNFAAPTISHIGLGVAGINIAKSLKAAGYRAEVWQVRTPVELRQRLNMANSREPDAKVTHVVISAPWIPTLVLQEFARMFPTIEWAVNCHSNVGFLQADTNGVTLIREGIALEMSETNFRMAGNSQKFCAWVKQAYLANCTYLPNLYHLDRPPAHRPLWSGGVLKIGAFGAQRPLKNLMSAAGAALSIASTLKANVEFSMNSGRAEGGGSTVVNSVAAMLSGLPNIRLTPLGWCTWPQFRQVVAQQALLISPSYTESFNMVTADGAATGVPSVVSDSIAWAPAHWKAEIDDVVGIARVGMALLRDPNAATEGYHALVSHNTEGLRAWEGFLNGK